MGFILAVASIRISSGRRGIRKGSWAIVTCLWSLSLLMIEGLSDEGSEPRLQLGVSVR